MLKKYEGLCPKHNPPCGIFCRVEKLTEKPYGPEMSRERSSIIRQRILIAGFLLLAGGLLKHAVLEGDTIVLLHNAQDTLRQCIGQGRFQGCREANQFPLYQFLPAFFLSALGFELGTIGLLLAYLSFGAFLCSLVLIFRVLKRVDKSQALSHFAVLIYLSGYLVRYAWEIARAFA